MAPPAVLGCQRGLGRIAGEGLGRSGEQRVTAAGGVDAIGEDRVLAAIAQTATTVIHRRWAAGGSTIASRTASPGITYIAECNPAARKGSSVAVVCVSTPAAVAACAVK